MMEVLLQASSNISPLLSICIPTYNRPELLERLLHSIPQSIDLQIVIVNDGSTTPYTDGILSLISSFPNHTYISSSNNGRFSAIKSALSYVTGFYSLISDDDDIFNEESFTTLLRLLSSRLDSCYLFGCYLPQRDLLNLPNPSITNFIQARAEFGFKYDLKQVVRSNLLVTAVDSVRATSRRVPSGLIWLYVSQLANCVTYPISIVTKYYYSNGLTNNIHYHKMTNKQVMFEYYSLLSHSFLYANFFYRIRSYILYYRYSLHLLNPPRFSPYLILLPFSLVIYVYDLLLISLRK